MGSIRSGGGRSSTDYRAAIPLLSSSSTTSFPATSFISTTSTRSVLRMREKYILMMTVATFVVFCVGGFFFLPELKAGTQMAYRQIKEIGPDLAGIRPPVGMDGPRGGHDSPAAEESVGAAPPESRYVLPAPDFFPHQQHKPGKLADMKILADKIRRDMNNSQPWAVAPKPFESLHEDQASQEDSRPSTSRSGLDWQPQELPSGEDTDPETSRRREHVKAMMRHGWDNYVQFAWGENELRPVSRKGHSPGIFGKTKLGASIIDAMDTLWIMGMKDEFRKGRDWIDHNLSLDQVHADISVFEFNIRFIGGLLSCYALTKDDMFIWKADAFAHKLLPAFDTPTGIPYALINPTSGFTKNYAWASSSASILSEIGSLHLEFVYLSRVTGKTIYRDKVLAIRDYLDKISKPNGLYPNYINPKTGIWGQHHMSIGALGDSFYEYLLKEYIQSGGSDSTALRMYEEAIDGVTSNLLQTSVQNHLMYFADMKYDRLEHKMDHLACFSGGLLGLGSQFLVNKPDKRIRHMEIAAGITNTCHESYVRTPTRIGPESFRFTDAVEAKAARPNEKYYILRPEVIESYFIMWRLTKDQKYRDWAWDAVQAIEKFCRVENGYSGLKNVYDVSGVKDDVQQSFLFAELLKYLYLIFSNDDLIPLDQWVFNTEAHPLPISGKNPAF